MTQEQTPNPWRQRLPLIALMFVFIAPVVVAYGLLHSGVYKTLGTTNKGQLFEQPIDLKTLALIDQNGKALQPEMLHDHWWLVYNIPEQCLEQCEQRLLQIRQSIQALGPEKHRVKPLFLRSSQGPHKALDHWLSQMPQTKVMSYDQMALEQQIGPQTNPEALILVDPLGNGMLHYDPVSEAEAAIQQAKKMVKDIKHLLKVSRIG